TCWTTSSASAGVSRLRLQYASTCDRAAAHSASKPGAPAELPAVPAEAPALSISCFLPEARPPTRQSDPRLGPGPRPALPVLTGRTAGTAALRSFDSPDVSTEEKDRSRGCQSIERRMRVR